MAARSRQKNSSSYAVEFPSGQVHTINTETVTSPHNQQLDLPYVRDPLPGKNYTAVKLCVALGRLSGICKLWEFAIGRGLQDGGFIGIVPPYVLKVKDPDVTSFLGEVQYTWLSEKNEDTYRILRHIMRCSTFYMAFAHIFTSGTRRFCWCGSTVSMPIRRRSASCSTNEKNTH